MSARQTDPNRHQMLAKVRRDWIDGYLKHSLDNLARIELGLEEKPGTVRWSWDAIVQQPNRAPRPLPPGRAMGAVFDELGQALLILGAPGAGKTTLLLELARDLLERAEQDVTHPIPVVFHLASWAIRRRPLADWLVEELTERYYVPRKLARDWTDTEQVLPLLDGLDEVAPEHRATCVEAINAFRRQHGAVPLAVCSRETDYHALSARVELSGAVVIKPLSREQVSAYLKQAGRSLAVVRTMLEVDETLWELLQTPLMLSIVALAYRNWSAAQIWVTGSLEQRRAHLFTSYIERMFERRAPVVEYTREQTLCWLTWLARSLRHNNLSIFYVELMQPDWLPTRAQRWTVAAVPFMFIGLMFGLPGGLMFGLAFGLVSGLVFGLFIGLMFGLLFMLAIGQGGGLDRIVPVEKLRWSWRRALRSSIIGLFFGLAIGSETGRDTGPMFMLAIGLFFGLMFGLVGGLAIGQGSELLEIRTIPNEGIRRSLRNALISFLSAGLFIGLMFGLAGGLVNGLAGGLAGGLMFGLVVGLATGLANGGSAYIKHYVLRIILCANNYAPWNYIRFLDYAAERVFLRKVGGGYIFTHRLLMEYFAMLQPTKPVKPPSIGGADLL